MSRQQPCIQNDGGLGGTWFPGLTVLLMGRLEGKPLCWKPYLLRMEAHQFFRLEKNSNNKKKQPKENLKPPLWSTKKHSEDAQNGGPDLRAP